MCDQCIPNGGPIARIVQHRIETEKNEAINDIARCLIEEYLRRCSSSSEVTIRIHLNSIGKLSEVGKRYTGDASVLRGVEIVLLNASWAVTFDGLWATVCPQE